MRYSRAFIPTLRETPAEAEIASHQLLLRAGYIRQVARGIYTYLPLGWRVMKKIMAIAREELDAASCDEVQMPCVIPAELWKQTGRWETFGSEMLRMTDRSRREYCFGPTHEEVITTLVGHEVRSYKELPKNLYQIHTKFRDEIRPRFGLMRGREFIMHDGYSFHASDEDLDREYDVMCAVYQRILQRCGLATRVVEAATGAMGGRSSHEVMVLAETGESAIAHCAECAYAANVEKAECRSSVVRRPSSASNDVPALKEVHTPGLTSIEAVSPVLGIEPHQMIKTLVLLRDGGIVVALINGDVELNVEKLQSATGATFVEMADEATIMKLTGAAVGYAGPVRLPKAVAGVGPVTVLADPAVMALAVGATGANTTDYHLSDVVPGRDFSPDQVVDLRLVGAGDGCPRCESGTLHILRGIEVGHIFKLGTKYSASLKAVYLDHEGKEQQMIMGTYGLGIGRTAAAAVEQHHDDRGLVWPVQIAPYHMTVLLLNSKNEEHVRYADDVYARLQQAGFDVLYDDRPERAGVKFADAELMGIPYAVVIGGKGVEAQQVELKVRATGEATMQSLDAVMATVREALAGGGGPSCAA